jgi:hypothetical protein
MHNYDCITRRTVFRNMDKRAAARNQKGENSKVIQKACSLTVDIEHASESFYVVQLSGRY